MNRHFRRRAAVKASHRLGSGHDGVAAGAPHGLRWLSLWTTDDTTVSPPDSARLAGAIDVPGQSVCPRQRITHSQLPTSPVVAAMVLQAIGAGPIARPSAADCPA